MLSQIPEEILNALSDKLSQLQGKSADIKDFHFVSGGCINHCGRVETTAGVFFIKWNDAGKYPIMFEKEMNGLELLKESSPLRVPKVIATGTSTHFEFLVIEWIERGRAKRDFWASFGRRLAEQHQWSDRPFGLDHNNYIGSLPQDNTTHNDWIEFFVVRRLTPQLKLAIDSDKMGRHHLTHFDQLFKRLDDLLVVERGSSLLHGDLWSGNFLVDQNGNECLVDPAVYYGHREMDLAFTVLFGGFDQEFYHSYNEVSPLTCGWQQRLDIYNLYPLLVHVNLFGGGYLRQVEQILHDLVR